METEMKCNLPWTKICPLTAVYNNSFVQLQTSIAAMIMDTDPM